MAESHGIKGATVAAVLLLLGLLLAALIWSEVRGGMEADGNSADDPFAAIDEKPLIAGEGLGPEGPESIPWPAEEAGFTTSAGAVSSPRTAAGPPSARIGSDRAPDARAADRGAEVGDAFTRLDRNGDGRLSPAEFAIYRVAGVKPNQQGRKADDMAPFVPTKALNLAIPEFRRLDRDNDWFMSAAEFELRQQ